MTKIACSLFIAILFISCSQRRVKPHITSGNDSLSYSLGMLYASKLPDNLKANHIDSVSYELFLEGIRDYIDSTSINLISDEDVKSITQNFLNNKLEKAHQEYLSSFSKNIEIGKTFLDENKKKPVIQVIEPGLQIKTVYSGWGQKKPTLKDDVLVHYKIYDTNIELIYDSKKDSKEPVKISLDSTILAWQKIIPMFVTGAKVVIYCSHEYAYGESFSPDKTIEPYQTLVFEVELVKFISKNEQQTQTTNVKQPSITTVAPKKETKNNNNTKVNTQVNTQTDTIQ